MADKNRRGEDDAAEHGLDDVFDDAIDDDVDADADADADEKSAGKGGTAVKSRKSEKTERSGGPFGRLGRFFREMIGELRKVIWPTRKELLTYTAVVVVFVVVMLSIVGVLDFLYAKGVLFVFGNPTTE